MLKLQRGAETQALLLLTCLNLNSHCIQCRSDSWRCTQGTLEAWVDPNVLQTFKGVAAVPDAIEAMLEGGHVGKVVVQIV